MINAARSDSLAPSAAQPALRTGARLPPPTSTLLRNPHSARGTSDPHDSRVPSLEAFGRRPRCLPPCRDGLASETLVWGFGCQAPIFWPSASGKVRLFARAGPSLRPAAANPPFFCSTAPQAFFRPDRGLPPPARADDVKAGRAAATEGSAFTSAS